MPTPKIGIIYHRDQHPGARGLDDLTDEQGSACFCDEVGVDLGEALRAEHEHDSHLILYTLEDKDGDQCWARVSKKSPFVTELLGEGGRVSIPFVAFDYDLEIPDPNFPDRDDKFVKREWHDRDEVYEFLEQLDALGLPAPTYFYTTLHGCRIVYVLDEPVDHLKAEGLLLGLMRDYAEAGIEFDEVCKDWTRLFRMPKTDRQDAGKFFETECFVYLEDPESTLDADSIEPGSLFANGDYAEATPYDGEAPDPDEIRDLLETKTRAGRPRDTDWVRKARTMLSGRQAEGVCFNHQPIDVSMGWNNGVLALVGQIVTMTARQMEASPEGIYALIFSAIEQLQADDSTGETDWYETSWSMVCRMWANEQAQIIHENREKQLAIEEGKKVKENLLDKLRTERPQDVPKDEEEAREWMQQRMVASQGSKHYVLCADGSYNLRPVPNQLLVSMIRDLGMEDVIEITEMRGKTWGYKSTQDILNHSSTPITGLTCVAREGLAFIEGGAGMRELNIPIHRLNPNVRPVFSQPVADWLQALGGDQTELLTEWLSHALTVDQPICSLNLYGSPGTGKGMLAQGLAECFQTEALNDGRALGKWNRGLLDTPIVFCDEGVPSLKSDESPSVDQAFRSLVSGGTITIRAMNTDPFTARIYPRILFMSNDPDIIRSIVGHRDLTDDDVRAIELRLLSLQVSDEAHMFLTSRGNYKFTNGWVHGKRPSKYTLASHIMWLHQNRTPSANSSGRLLVEGQTQTALVRGMRLRSQAAQTVMAALMRMLNNPNQPKGLHINEGCVWVTPAGIRKILESAFSTGELVSLPVIGRVLRQFSDQDAEGKVNMSNPPGTDRSQRARWFTIDLGILYEEGLRYGEDTDRIERLLGQQPHGHLKIQQAQMMSKK